MVAIVVTTAAESNASRVGDVATSGWAAENGARWHGSVDRVDSDGRGRVHIECPSQEVADAVVTTLEEMDEAISYSVR